MANISDQCAPKRSVKVSAAEIDKAQKLDTTLTALRKPGLDPEECRWEQLETCWNCGEERMCRETSLGPVCSHECAEQLFAFPDNIGGQTCGASAPEQKDGQ